MVAPPWRRLTRAARWKGQAHQVTTGVTSTATTTDQPANCRAGIIAIAIAGTVNAADTSTRRRAALAVAAFAASGVTVAWSAVIAGCGAMVAGWGAVAAGWGAVAAGCRAMVAILGV